MFTLKSYNGKHFPGINRVFILCKGENSGKPSLMPFVNSFVATCETQAEAELIYILSYGLWQSRQYHSLLRGSVIPFITIDDMRGLLVQAYTQALDRPLFIETVRKIMDIERLIAYRQQQASKLQQIKVAMMRHHFTPVASCPVR
jgi:hypothetical protein